MTTPAKRVFLVILDGFGIAGPDKGNAILAAGMPYLDSLIAQYPTFAIAAAGLTVGLPWGQQGNSEVGHSAIGTGRVVIQDLARINGEIRSGEFYENPALLKACEHAKKHDSSLHLIGCTSPGGIHSHTDHLIALLELVGRNGVKRTFLHFIADGQDMPPQDARNVLKMLEPFLTTAGARIASIQGRSFAMDRVLNWELTGRVWHAMTLGDAHAIADPVAYLEDAYANGITDYGLEPATVVSGGRPVGPVQDNDAMIFFDFRNDRARQLANPFIAGAEFDSFDRIRPPKNVMVVTMTKYAEEFDVPVAYESVDLNNTLGQIISENGFKQWRIAEKEKEAHVTNFFNGGRIKPFDGEGRDIVSSRMMRGKEYVAHPEMSAQKIVDSVRDRASGDARLYVVNFANPDMIAHTGDFSATVAAIKVVDGCLKRLIPDLTANPDNVVVVTADHGNAEELVDPLTGGQDTQHSTRAVPIIFIGRGFSKSGQPLDGLSALADVPPVGTLIDVAPSVLSLLDIEIPREVTGTSIINR